jgi:hypothetical protein
LWRGELWHYVEDVIQAHDFVWNGRNLDLNGEVRFSFLFEKLNFIRDSHCDVLVHVSSVVELKLRLIALVGLIRLNLIWENSLVLVREIGAVEQSLDLLLFFLKEVTVIEFQVDGDVAINCVLHWLLCSHVVLWVKSFIPWLGSGIDQFIRVSIAHVDNPLKGVHHNAAEGRFTFKLSLLPLKSILVMGLFPRGLKLILLHKAVPSLFDVVKITLFEVLIDELLAWESHWWDVLHIVLPSLQVYLIW